MQEKVAILLSCALTSFFLSILLSPPNVQLTTSTTTNETPRSTPSPTANFQDPSSQLILHLRVLPPIVATNAAVTLVVALCWCRGVWVWRYGVVDLVWFLVGYLGS